MDGCYLFRKLMDMLLEEGMTIESAKFDGFQIELDTKGDCGAVSIRATLWEGQK